MATYFINRRTPEGDSQVLGPFTNKKEAVDQLWNLSGNLRACYGTETASYSNYPVNTFSIWNANKHYFQDYSIVEK